MIGIKQLSLINKIFILKRIFFIILKEHHLILSVNRSNNSRWITKIFNNLEICSNNSEWILILKIHSHHIKAKLCHKVMFKIMDSMFLAQWRGKELSIISRINHYLRVFLRITLEWTIKHLYFAKAVDNALFLMN